MNLSRSDAVLMTLAVCLVLAGGSAARGQRADFVIGSKKFPESRLLGEIMATLIEARTSLTIDRRHGLGGTMICFTAMENGELDLYAEYTGTGLVSILEEPLGDDRDPQSVYQRVRRAFKDRYGLIWLKPFGFNNTYAIAVRGDYGLKTISDLANRTATARAGFSHEFLERADGYPGLVEAYGFRLANVRGLEHGLAYLAMREKQIDVMDAYATDGKLLKYELTLLEDDRRFFPPYFAAPLIREEKASEFPRVVELLNQLGGRLGQQRMLDLNHAVEVEGRGAHDVAVDFLRQEGLLPDDYAEDKGSWIWHVFSGDRSGRGMSLVKLVPLVFEHLVLTISATGMATVAGIFLGLVVVRYPRLLAGPVLGAAGVVQTIPSLALLCFMIPLLGIGRQPAIAALFLYALLPIVRNTYTGIASVPQELVEAGRGMGMTRRQLMLGLEIPLAIKTIMAGIRTTLVINIGTATIAAFIGAGGLGEPIVTGLSLNDTGLILWGAIPAALLALVCDFLMARLERLIEPKGLRAAQP